jgi:glycosyltransferase involved in cell wall biosynthesis
VVSSDGGPRENMVEGVTGYVCHTDAADEWARAVVRVLRPPAGVAATTGGMGMAAREFALTRPWSEALQPLYRAYREVTAHVELQDSDLERARAGGDLLRG